ncbi:MAG: hypothetical protein FWC49_01425, partial [Proteobacteria bacterium]|nr:hypothetical protein [Pseudomonadota bacterium]
RFAVFFFGLRFKETKHRWVIQLEQPEDAAIFPPLLNAAQGNWFNCLAKRKKIDAFPRSYWINGSSLV